MPPLTCVQCGTPYDTELTLSTPKMKSSMRRARFGHWTIIFLTLALFLKIYNDNPSPKKPPASYETTGEGVIRYYGQITLPYGQTNQTANILLFEGTGGEWKNLSPICQNQLSVHAHMKVEIHFRWMPYNRWSTGRGPENEEECYNIINIRQTGPDAQ